MIEKLNILSFRGIIVYVDDNLQNNQCLRGRKSGDSDNNFIIVSRNIANALIVQKINDRDKEIEKLIKD